MFLLFLATSHSFQTREWTKTFDIENWYGDCGGRLFIHQLKWRELSTHKYIWNSTFSLFWHMNWTLGTVYMRNQAAHYLKKMAGMRSVTFVCVFDLMLLHSICVTHQKSIKNYCSISKCRIAIWIHFIFLIPSRFCFLSNFLIFFYQWPTLISLKNISFEKTSVGQISLRKMYQDNEARNSGSTVSEYYF